MFVACPRGGRYGDVRKTLAALLQRPFTSISIAPKAPATIAPTSQPVVPFEDSDLVPEDKGTILTVRIVGRSEPGDWVLE